MPEPMIALFTLGGGEIVLILILLAILVIPVAVVAVVILLVVRANKRKREVTPGAVPPRIPPTGS